MKEHYLVIYACDTSPDGTQCGRETIFRLEKAISFIKTLSNPSDVEIILGAGKDPTKPGNPALKELMRDYLIDRFNEEALEERVDIIPAITCANGNPWGTFSETVKVFEMIQYEIDPQVTVISSDYHINRILRIWKLTAPGITVYSIPVYSVPSLKNRLLEPLKGLKVFFDHYRYRTEMNKRKPPTI